MKTQEKYSKALRKYLGIKDSRVWISDEMYEKYRETPCPFNIIDRWNELINEVYGTPDEFETEVARKI